MNYEQNLSFLRYNDIIQTIFLNFLNKCPKYLHPLKPIGIVIFLYSHVYFYLSLITETNDICDFFLSSFRDVHFMLSSLYYSGKYNELVDKLKRFRGKVVVSSSWFRELIVVICLASQGIVLYGAFKSPVYHLGVLLALYPPIRQFLFVVSNMRLFTLFCIALKSLRLRLLNVCQMIAEGDVEDRAIAEFGRIVDCYMELMTCLDYYEDIFSFMQTISHYTNLIAILGNIYTIVTRKNQSTLYGIPYHLVNYTMSLALLGAAQHTAHALAMVRPAAARLNCLANGDKLRRKSKAFLSLVEQFPPSLLHSSIIIGSLALLANCVVTLLQFLGVI